MGVKQRWVRYFPDTRLEFDNPKWPNFDLLPKLNWNSMRMDIFQLIAFEQKSLLMLRIQVASLKIFQKTLNAFYLDLWEVCKVGIFPLQQFFKCEIPKGTTDTMIVHLEILLTWKHCNLQISKWIWYHQYNY